MTTYIILFNNNLYEVGAVRLRNNKLYLPIVNTKKPGQNIYAMLNNVLHARFNIQHGETTCWWPFYHEKNVFIVASTNYEKILRTSEHTLPPNICDVGWTSPSSLATKNDIVMHIQQQLKALLWFRVGRCVDVLHLRYKSPTISVARMCDIVKDYVDKCEYNDNNTTVVTLGLHNSHGVGYGKYVVI